MALPYLSHLAAGFHLVEHRSHMERVIKVDGRQNHALALDAHHLARSEVGYEEHILADELLRLVVSRDARKNGAVYARAVVDSELQELLRLLYLLAVLDMTDADVELLECVEVYALSLIGAAT